MALVDTLTDPVNIATAALAVLSFATITTLASPLLRGEKLETRMKSVATRREELRRRSRQALAKNATGGSTLRRTDNNMLRAALDRLKVEKLLEDPKILDQLAQAGFRGPKPVTTFYFFRFVAPFILAVLAGIYLFAVNSHELVTIHRLMICFLAFFVGFYAPALYVGNVASKRRTSIVGAFPDALDLLLICVESGMSVEAALQKVGAEMGGSSIELAEELALLVAELSYLPDRRLAYEGLSKRVNHPGIKSVCTAMIQAERYGTPLGAALRVMAHENRALRMSAAEKKAAALPAQLTVPMIVFFLPVLFVVILGPAILKISDMNFGGG
jgi:tight adherence protein C